MLHPDTSKTADYRPEWYERVMAQEHLDAADDGVDDLGRLVLGVVATLVALILVTVASVRWLS